MVLIFFSEIFGDAIGKQNSIKKIFLIIFFSNSTQWKIKIYRGIIKYLTKHTYIGLNKNVC